MASRGSVAFGEDYATDAASPKADIRQQDDGALATNAYLAVVFHQLGRAGLRQGVEAIYGTCFGGLL
jgi:hypothetical protein